MTDISWLGPSIDVRSLFARQQAAFIELLRGLGPGQWTQPTICPGWDVKDVAAHVLGDHIGRLSRHRDGYRSLHSLGSLDRFNVDPDALGEAVSWAGPGPAPTWLDAARDFSEYWTHHQQICDATGQPGLMSPGYARPVIGCRMPRGWRAHRPCASPPRS
jgi:hypothetical protein